MEARRNALPDVPWRHGQAAIPERGLDFHSFRGQDDPAFITRMLAWLRAHHAIGVYWAFQHVAPDQAVPPGRCCPARARTRGARRG